MFRRANLLKRWFVLVLGFMRVLGNERSPTPLVRFFDHGSRGPSSNPEPGYLRLGRYPGEITAGCKTQRSPSPRTIVVYTFAFFITYRSRRSSGRFPLTSIIAPSHRLRSCYGVGVRSSYAAVLFARAIVHSPEFEM